MMRTLLTVFACSLLIGCSARSDMRTRSDWLYGKWVTAAVSSSVVERQRHKARYDEPIEKHIMWFKRDGELRRYSDRKGWVRLLIDFRIEGNTVMMHPHTEKTFFPLAKRTDEGLLEMLVPPSGGFLYRKVADNASIDDLDLDGPISIETPHNR